MSNQARKEEVTAFSYASTELGALVEAKKYYRWILNRFVPHLGKRIIEVGAGIGTFSEFLLNGTNCSSLLIVEPAENLCPLLQERFSCDTRVKVVQGYLEDMASSLSADSVVSVNVLEHIADDETYLQRAHQILVSGGTILLLVPALPWLFGKLDEAFGHVRRYTKSSLADKLLRAGFHLTYLRYSNFPGVITWFLAGKVLRRRTLRPADVRLYDRWVVPWISRLERHWEPPIGQSLMAIARK